jgi:bifunctional non-homologous end joining protein LigD
VSWEEVEGCRAPEDLRFLPDDVLARLEKAGDLLEPVAKGDCQTPLPD